MFPSFCRCFSVEVFHSFPAVAVVKAQPIRAEQCCQTDKSRSTVWLVGSNGICEDMLAQYSTNVRVLSPSCCWSHVAVRKATLPLKVLLLFWMLQLVGLMIEGFTSSVLPASTCWTRPSSKIHTGSGLVWHTGKEGEELLQDCLSFNLYIRLG